jgi:hypothetical protein
MLVLFSKSNEFVSELARLNDENQPPALVRVSYKVLTNAGTGISQVYLAAGFYHNGLLVTMDEYLWSGPTAQIEVEGIPASCQVARKWMEGNCRDLGITVGAGMYMI